MSTHEGGEPEGARPAEDTALADAVDEAMAPELERSFVAFHQQHVAEQGRVRPPRPREEVDDILDELRHANRDDGSG